MTREEVVTDETKHSFLLSVADAKVAPLLTDQQITVSQVFGRAEGIDRRERSFSLLGLTMKIPVVKRMYDRLFCRLTGIEIEGLSEADRFCVGDALFLAAFYLLVDKKC